MAQMRIIFGIIILQIYVNAAPSATDSSKIEDIAKIKEAGPKLDAELHVVQESKKNYSSAETFRQKRYYNHFGFGFPPVNPVIYPSYVKRDESAYTGNYGAEDTYNQIHRRLQEITSSFIRQPAPPPPPTSHFPLFFPVIFVPQACACIPTDNNNPNKSPKNITQTPTSTEKNDSITPNVTERLGEEAAVTDTDSEDYEENRPISFNPIGIKRKLARPPPAIEHGSSQAGASSSNPTTTTITPVRRPENVPTGPSNFQIPVNIATRAPTFNPVTAQPTPTTTITLVRRSVNVPTEPSSFQAPVNVATRVPSFNDVTAQPAPAQPASAQSAPSQPVLAESEVEAPSVCDAAVLSCCHQRFVTYDCFTLHGCPPNNTTYVNPCEMNMVLRVINKFQNLYGKRNTR